MNDKLLAQIVSTIVMAACCLGGLAISARPGGGR